MGVNSRETVVVFSPAENLGIRVLKLALEHTGVRAIAKKIKRSPATVSRIVNDWVRKGYITNSAPRGAVASFERGPNLPEQLFHQLFHDGTPLATEKTATTVGCGSEVFHFDPMPIIGGEPTPGFIPMRVHSLGHHFKVLKDVNGEFFGPRRPVPWSRTTLNSGVPTHVLNIPVNGHDLTDERRVKIVYREGGGNQSVEVWTPEVIITSPLALQEFDQWAASRAQRVANWLSKRYGFKLGIVEMCRDPHFAAAVPNEVARAAKEIGLKTPDLWCDNSRGRGELETENKAKAVSIMDMPGRVERLEDVIYHGLTPTLERMIDTQNDMVKGFTVLNQYLEKLLGLAEKPEETSKPNDSDPGGMFG